MLLKDKQERKKKKMQELKKKKKRKRAKKKKEVEIKEIQNNRFMNSVLKLFVSTICIDPFVSHDHCLCKILRANART